LSHQTSQPRTRNFGWCSRSEHQGTAGLCSASPAAQCAGASRGAFTWGRGTASPAGAMSTAAHLPAAVTPWAGIA